jgi:epoxide hydrolase 4
MVIEKTVRANDQEFHVLTAGDPSLPLVLCLHGFPEFSGGWSGVLPKLADRYYVVAPDQRGYGQSSKPVGVEQYRAHHLANDMLKLVDVLAPGRPMHLVAHDWGASIAYLMAFVAPARITKLVVINGVHPSTFQHALLHDPEQAAASQYIHFLRRDDAAALLSEDNFRRLLAFLSGGFGGGRWLSDVQRTSYIQAWSRDGALEAMVSWYRASPLVVPKPGETAWVNPVAHISRDRMRVMMPHLVLWGEEDKALRPSCLTDLGSFCTDLKIETIAEADHWIIHQQPDAVVQRIRQFLA